MPNFKIIDKIIEDVKTRGDAAVRDYTKQFDGIELDSFLVTAKEIRQAYRAVGSETIKAINFAKKSIAFFAKKQMAQLKNFEVKRNGMILGQRVVPIKKIGAYVPGGNYPLPSTALMCIVPARIAGVEEIIACSPKIRPETVVAADIAGADTIFNIGGAQAIAAMAYGTQQIPKVDKIAGPGNAYVTYAKKAVYGECGIDSLAGPSEIMVIADDSSRPELIALDLLAQLEHAADARAFLVSTSGRLIERVRKSIEGQLPLIPTERMIRKSIDNLNIKLVKNLDEAFEFADSVAPEHLVLGIKNAEKCLEKVSNYGSLFLGSFSAVAFGDYCSGTNHVLPTGGTARFSNGLSVREFVKIHTYQKITKKGARILAPSAMRLSQVEGLEAHKRSVQIRMQKIVGRIPTDSSKIIDF